MPSELLSLPTAMLMLLACCTTHGMFRTLMCTPAPTTTDTTIPGNKDKLSNVRIRVAPCVSRVGLSVRQGLSVKDDQGLCILSMVATSAHSSLRLHTHVLPLLAPSVVVPTVALWLGCPAAKVFPRGQPTSLISSPFAPFHLALSDSSVSCVLHPGPLAANGCLDPASSHYQCEYVSSGIM